MIDHDLEIRVITKLPNSEELDEWPKKWLMTFNSDKTEIMLFSNTDIAEFNFTFNERTIPITILTNIWELHLAAMLNGIYMLKIYC